jgi:hypothetical protein
MKLKQFVHLQDYRFELTFENGETIVADLGTLIAEHVAPQETQSARINPEWGCLEFKAGIVDIEPKTLYRFALTASQQQAA